MKSVTVTHQEDNLLSDGITLERPLDERYEFPAAKVYDPLGYVSSEMHQRNLSVVGVHTLVGQERVVDSPGLLEGSLRVVEPFVFE